MSKITKIALISIGAGIVLCFLAYVISGGEWTKFNSKGIKYESKTYESEKKVEKIILDETANSILVQSGDTDKVTIEYQDNVNGSLYNIEEKNGTLSFERNDRKFFSLFTIDFTDKKIIMTVPSDYAGEMELDLTSGSMDLEGVSAKQLKLDNTSGSIKVNNVSVSEDISIDNTSGSIRFENLKAGGDIKMECTSGSIKGSIDGKESDFSIHSDVTSGSSNLKESEGGKQKLDAETTSGSIKITFND